MSNTPEFDWRNPSVEAMSADLAPKGIHRTTPPFSGGMTTADSDAIDSFEASMLKLGEGLPLGPVATDTAAPDDGYASKPCLSGPCRHHVEIAQIKGVVGDPPMEHLYRYQFCDFLREESGTMPTQEQQYRYCTRYAPPMLSAAGWSQRFRSAPYIMSAARRHHLTPELRDRILGALHTVCEHIGLAKPIQTLDVSKTDEEEVSR